MKRTLRKERGEGKDVVLRQYGGDIILVVNKYINNNISKYFLLYLLAAFGLVVLGVLQYQIQVGKILRGYSAIASPIILACEMLFFVICLQKIRKADFFLQGSEGEDAVKEHLKKLFSSYRVLENIVIDNQPWNIDFVVVGPRGVSIIEAKSNKGRFTYHDRILFQNNFRTKFIWQVESQVKSLGKLLHEKLKYTSGINALIVFTSPLALNIRDDKPLPNTNIVLTKVDRLIVNILEPKGNDLDCDQINQIVEVLKEYQKD